MSLDFHNSLLNIRLLISSFNNFKDLEHTFFNCLQYFLYLVKINLKSIKKIEEPEIVLRLP